MAAPFDNAVSIAQTQISAALKELWDPRILQAGHRLSGVTKFFRLITTPWAGGTPGVNFFDIRVKDQLLHSARMIGNISTANSTGTTFAEPAQTIGYTKWRIGEDDLMTIQCPVTYRFKSNVIIGASEIGPIAQQLAEESVANVVEREEIAILTGQNNFLARVKKMTDTQGLYTATPTSASTERRLWLTDGSAALFHKGDLIDPISGSGSYALDLGTGAAATHLEVRDTGFDRGASGVYGWLDCKTNPAGGASTYMCTAVNVAAAKTASSAYWLALTGEYDTDATPADDPVDAATAKGMYGLRDWFRTQATAGVIYNKTRTTVGNGWTLPVNLNKSTVTVLSLADIVELLTMVYQQNLRDPELTEYVLFCGVRTAEKIVELVGVANRFLDGTAQAQTKLVNNYGFNGTMIRCPSVGTSIAVQGLRGMDEGRVYLLQPGVMRLIQPGGISWINWNEQGAVWNNVANSSGTRTDVYRADRQVTANTLIELPRFCGGITGIKPD